MAIIKWTFWGVIWLIIAAFFHYTLPQVDIVRITDTYEKRIDFGENSIFWSHADVGNSTALGNRDVFFIQTRRAKGDVMVYRNEDTGWIWPPYFKFDSSDLQAQAAANISPAKDQWVVITHYGWRNKYLSIYPNAIGIRPIDGPNVTVIPWFNIGFFLFLLIAWAFLRAAWRQFRERTIDPALKDAGEKWDSVEGNMAERRGRFSRWLDTWKKK